MKRIILSLLILCAGVVTSMAQNVIKGTVTDKKDGKPVVGAQVSPKKGSESVFTDINGAFILETKELPKKLIAEYVGMHQARGKVKKVSESVDIEMEKLRTDYLSLRASIRVATFRVNGGEDKNIRFCGPAVGAELVYGFKLSPHRNGYVEVGFGIQYINGENWGWRIGNDYDFEHQELQYHESISAGLSASIGTRKKLSTNSTIMPYCGVNFQKSVWLHMAGKRGGVSMDSRYLEVRHVRTGVEAGLNFTIRKLFLGLAYNLDLYSYSRKSGIMYSMSPTFKGGFLF